MEENDKNFEDNLHDILSSGPDKNLKRKNGPVVPKPIPENKKGKSTTFSIAEIFFRIVAGLIALGLLILFGLQASQR